jgi:hypothetical protein
MCTQLENVVLLSFTLLYNDLTATGLEIFRNYVVLVVQCLYNMASYRNVTSLFLQMTCEIAGFEFCIDLTRWLYLKRPPSHSLMELSSS